MSGFDIDLSTAANLAEIIGASTIVTGLVFGWSQLRQHRIQQRAAVTSDLMRTFYSRDLAEAIALLHNVRDGVSLSELRAKGSEFEAAAVTVTTSFETMGLLVFKRIASLDLVNDLAGGIVSTMQRKLARYEEEVRVEQNQPSWGEWFEWLAGQVEQVKVQHAPAHVRLRDWRP